MNLFVRPNMRFARFCKQFATEATQKEKWDLFSAVSLERLPVISRELTDMEKKVAGILSEIEFENSHLSDFEKRIEEENKRAQMKDLSAMNVDEIPKQTTHDFIDACQSELKQFQFAEGVRKGDSKSTDRELDRRLLLLIEDDIGAKKHWVLPQGKFSQGETSLRETAERVVKEKLGNSMVVKFLGNAPSGFYKYKYPKSVSNRVVGAKIFFFKAQLVSGNVDEKICKSYQWATRNQMDKLQDDYKNKVDMFLIDEEH
ncbi:39S ribosomal protein L46, mitochondrial [Cimex lectularius]|uniref:Large ribosomal subunit protein mL46 n=1 Tax=Cimex lectularius TaxID=79782 RepID=A0A8I6TFK7_CIMLE|nr:39S ribosomal protein L46, mitochondrial [Cimex lectularius]